MIHALPSRLRFHDGQVRTVPFGLWRLAWLWRRLEVPREESADAFAAYAGGDVLDIGAFEGWYSVLLAPKAAEGDRLVSVEPDRRAFAQLLSTLSMVGEVFPALTFAALPLAVGTGRPVEVSWPAGPEGHPRFAEAPDGGTPTVAVDRLVELLGLKPGFVKVDVEGAEVFVVEGMQSTLAEHRPIVLVEYHENWQPPGRGLADIRRLLEGHGYSARTLGVDEGSQRQLWTPTARHDIR
jgi:FkbM family methyltransferase